MEGQDRDDKMEGGDGDDDMFGHTGKDVMKIEKGRWASSKDYDILTEVINVMCKTEKFPLTKVSKMQVPLIRAIRSEEIWEDEGAVHFAESDSTLKHSLLRQKKLKSEKKKGEQDFKANRVKKH